MLSSFERYESLRKSLNTRRQCRHNLTWLDGNKAKMDAEKKRFKQSTQNARTQIEILRGENPKE